MTQDSGLFSGEVSESRSDGMLDMIYQLIEEAHRVHANMLVASVQSDFTVFEKYNHLSVIDDQIDTLIQMRANNKHRLQMVCKQ
jgi:hypothetical protein